MLCYAKSSSRRHRAFVAYILLLEKKEKEKKIMETEDLAAS